MFVVNFDGNDRSNWFPCQPAKFHGLGERLFFLVVDSGDKAREVRKNKMGLLVLMD